jgi:hypothetical protein
MKVLPEKLSVHLGSYLDGKIVCTDERGWETERRHGLRHWHKAKAAGNDYSLCPKVTASILDSRIQKGSYGKHAFGSSFYLLL